MAGTVFILGAGFNVDAGPAAGSNRVGESLDGPYVSNSYPLVGDPASICFPDSGLSPGTSIEERLQASIDAREFEPLRSLYRELMRLDYHLVPAMMRPGAPARSAYSRFFEAFPEAHFITFNYDSFVEAALYALGRWSPIDGYGVPVAAELMLLMPGDPPSAHPTSNLVLHLHGSLCVYTSEFEFSDPDRSGVRWVREKPRIDFLFDPEVIGDLFFPWQKVMDPFSGFAQPEERVIAPVPSKAAGLRRSVVAVGYNFSPADRDSFDFLFQTLREAPITRLHVVSPSAGEIVDRLRTWYRRIDCRPIPLTFGKWVDTGCSL